jgi:hypothetical protein
MPGKTAVKKNKAPAKTKVGGKGQDRIDLPAKQLLSENIAKAKKR